MSQMVPSKRFAAILAVAFVGIAHIAAAAEDTKPHYQVDSLKGRIKCGAGTTAQSTDELCYPGAKGDNAFALQLDPGLSAIQLELTFTPAASAFPAKTLRLAFDPLDDAKTTAWETKSGGKLVLAVLEAPRNTATDWTIKVLPPKDTAEPATVTWEQDFLLHVSSFYWGLKPLSTYSAAEQVFDVALPPADPKTNHSHHDEPGKLASSPSEQAALPAAPGEEGFQGWVREHPGAALASAVTTLLIPVAFTPRLRRLAWLAFAPFFSRLDETRVLEHPRRSILADVVRAQPGILAEAARRQSGLATGAFEHHVKVLLDHGVLRRVEMEGNVYLYVKDRSNPSGLSLSVAPLRMRLIQAIQSQPGQRQVDLARRLGVPEKNVRYHATWMARRGRIRLVPDGRAVRCYPI